jgi:hypothetical protein
MYLKILFICTVFLSNNIYAQKKAAPPPPPREIIAVAKQNDILKTDGFKIEFPAKPSRSVAPVETAFGKTSMVSYRLMTNLAFYNVNYLDFPTVITDKTETSLRFAAVKAALIKDAADRLISETEISFGGNPGVEYVIESKDTTLTTRCLFIQQRFFQLVVVTKGRQTKSTARVNDFNRKNVEQFINSFYVNELPKPQTTAVDLPEDFGIEINNSIFTSRFFGFSIKLPENWRIVEKEQTDVFKDLSVQGAENSSEKMQKSLDLSLKNTEILLFMTKADINAAVNSSVLAIAAEQVSFPNFDPKVIADSFLKNFLENDEVILKKTTVTKIGEVDFSWFEIENKVKKIKKRFYFANRKGIAFQLLLIYQNEVELRTMLDSLTTIRFAEAG